jgi:hypothetical protein
LIKYGTNKFMGCRVWMADFFLILRRFALCLLRRHADDYRPQNKNAGRGAGLDSDFEFVSDVSNRAQVGSVDTALFCSARKFFRPGDDLDVNCRNVRKARLDGSIGDYPVCRISNPGLPCSWRESVSDFNGGSEKLSIVRNSDYRG